MHIRHTQPSDAPSLSRICLLTADAGKNGESHHSIPELPGLVYAAPYVHLPYTAGFVLVTDAQEQKETQNSKDKEVKGVAGEERILGYTVFTYDVDWPFISNVLSVIRGR